MKILTWNCNGAFRNKFQYVDSFDADIYIIQECEDPSRSNHPAYIQFAENYLWIGHNKNSGLGIFAKKEITLENNNWPSFGLEYFICCKVNHTFDLLGVWGCNNYIEDIYTYLQIYKKQITNTLIGGDFNSNAIWDKKHKRRTHLKVVGELASIGLVSAYHSLTNTSAGLEKDPTYYMYRHDYRPYHIDYFFCQKEWINTSVIGRYEDWMLYSDHMPVLLEIDCENEVESIV